MRKIAYVLALAIGISLGLGVDHLVERAHAAQAYQGANVTNATGILSPANGGTGKANNAAATLTRTGNHALTITTTGTTGVTLPTSGTLYAVGGALGTPSSGTLTNATGLPISTGLTGAGTGVLTALGINVGSAGAPVVLNGALGTPSSGVATNLTGTAAGLSIGGNAATATALASNPADCSANQYATAIAASGALTCAQPSVADLSDGSTGTGAVVRANGPTFTGSTMGPGYYTVAGTTGSLANNVPATVVTMTGVGARYEVSCVINSISTIYTSFATAIFDGTNGRIVANNGAGLTITLSGLAAIQCQQGTGGAATINYVVTRFGT